MNNKIIYLALFIVSLLVYSCEEQVIGQYPVDNIPPKPVSNVSIENLDGAVNLSYELPDETDLLYVKAEYKLGNGEMRTVKTSVFSNKMYIKGFGRSQQQTIKLYAVDASQNESEPVNVEVHPRNAPIYTILEGIETSVTWGGFKVFWKNPLKEDIVLEVHKRNKETNEFTFVESFYSSEIDADKAVRGLDSTLTTFGIFIRDAYYNYTDTIEFQLKPLFEEAIPKSGFKGFNLSSKLKQHSAFGGPMSEMWDDITNVRTNCFYIMVGEYMPFFSMDLGAKVKLSRFRLWQRVDYLFALHNPKKFEWYGTNSSVAANDNENLDWENDNAWIRLGDYESKRPSGGKSGDPITAEDDAYAKAGEEFDVDIDAPSVRYLRFKLKSTWSGSRGLHINELSFWGLIEK